MKRAKENMILIRLMGGLGNQLFQYATARALAVKNDASLKVDLTLLKNRDGNEHTVYRDFELDAFDVRVAFASEEEIDYFNPTPGNLAERVVNKAKRLLLPSRVYIQNGTDYDERVSTLAAPVCLIGSLQSERYFKSIEPLLRSELVFRTRLHENAKPVAQQIAHSEAVAVHVRRGDYVTNPIYTELLGTKGPDYYRQAFDRMESMVENPHYFIFSDDIPWCVDHIRPEKPTTYVGAPFTGGDPVQDLMLMTRCKHFIIPNSTFSWWGAWLGSHPDKKVMAPKKWSNNGEADSADRLPPEWMLI
ncbi:MAG: alpha-1,2-fucosyltransferase [Rhodothermales bacterium]